MDDSFPAKRYKSNKTIVLRLDLDPHCMLVSNLWDWRYQTSQRLIIRSMVLQMQLVNAIGIHSPLRNRNYNCFPPIRRKVTRNLDSLKDNYLKEVIEDNWEDVKVTDNAFHPVPLKYHGLYIEHLATLLYREACYILQHFQMKS